VKRARVAVVGGGIFGCTAALHLTRAGFRVDLFEANDDLLKAASGINQYRLHRGYHYPRCVETALSSRDGDGAFRAEYGAAVVDDYEHYFAISRRDSLTSASAFLRFLEMTELEHEPCMPPFLRAEMVDLAVRVKESLFDPDVLRMLVWSRLRAGGVAVHLGERTAPEALRSYDFVVVATYARINAVLEEAGIQRDYQYEVCEKPVVRVPPALAGKSIVVMDGPFMCLDPFGRSGLFVMGNVVHAIHHTNVGKHPEVPSELAPHLDRGIVERPSITKFDLFIESAAEYMPDIRDVEHVGSMYTIRTVLPNTDATDTRPTIVRQVSDRTIVLLSGKVGTCVHAAEQTVRLIERAVHGDIVEDAGAS